MNLKEILASNAFINRKYVEFKWRERRISYGKENPDKTFYIIRRAPCSIGIFSYVATVLGHIKKAVDCGYIPVIDMQNYSNTYLEENMKGKVNAWEFFFKQPMGYTLDDIQKSKNVILSWGEGTGEFPGYTMATDDLIYKMWYGYSQKFLKISDEVQIRFERSRKELFENRRIVGVLCRGTDYLNKRPPRHPVQPEVEDLVEATEQMMKKNVCDYVYLATEDEEMYTYFFHHFKDRLITLDVKRYQDTGMKDINEIIFNRENDRYLKGMEYMTTILLLAHCNCLVAGCSGGTYGAMLLTPGYEDANVIFNGCYTTDGKL